jgi:hypothetical protein
MDATHGLVAILRDARKSTLLRMRKKSDLPVQPLSQKYFHSLLTQLTCISSAIPSHTEGRLAIVTDAGRDAVDADVPITNGAKADGEVVWS